MAKGESFTLDKLRECMRILEDIPPVPMLASWDMFPRDHALRFTWEGREYVGAHPDFWKQIPASERGQVQSLFALDIADFSLPHYRRQKADFFGAMAKAMEQCASPRKDQSNDG